MENLYSAISKVIDVPQDGWEDFKNIWSPVTLKAGDHFIEQGEKSEYVGFILKGYVANNWLTPEGKEVIKVFQFENCFIGSLSTLKGDVSFHSVKAMEDMQILRASTSDIFRVFAKNPIWDRMIRKMVEKAFFDKQNKENELLTFSAKERLESLKKSLGENISRIPKKDIALYLGIDPATLSRIQK